MLLLIAPTLFCAYGSSLGVEGHTRIMAPLFYDSTIQAHHTSINWRIWVSRPYLTAKDFTRQPHVRVLDSAESSTGGHDVLACPSSSKEKASVFCWITYPRGAGGKCHKVFLFYSIENISDTWIGSHEARLGLLVRPRKENFNASHLRILISASAFSGSQLTDFLYKAVGQALAIGTLPHARRELKRLAWLTSSYYLDSHSFSPDVQRKTTRSPWTILH